MRTGLIAKKLGMTSIYNEDGIRVPVTLLQLFDSQVISVKNDRNYKSVELAYGIRKLKNISKPIKGRFAKLKLEPKPYSVEFRVSEENLLPVGAITNIDHFVVGQYIDAKSVSVGKGFAGVMKRWNFAGLRASHGVSVSHRSHGSTGMCQDPGKVIKGKKMAGQLGATNVTVQNLKIISIDIENNIIAVKGSVPGHENSTVFLKDAVKKALPASAPLPAGLKNNSFNSIEANKDQGDANAS